MELILALQAPVMKKFPDSAKIFLHGSDRPLKQGEQVKQPDLAATIDPAHASSFAAPVTDDSGFESDDTTHFSVIDEAGNIVSNTYTLNSFYGSQVIAHGTLASLQLWKVNGTLRFRNAHSNADAVAAACPAGT